MRLFCPKPDDNPRLMIRSAALAERFGLSVAETMEAIGPDEPAWLALESPVPGGLALVVRDPEEPGCTTVLHGELVAFARRLARRPPSRRDAFARAVGKSSVHVVDATAGFGHDAVLLAAYGHQVTAIERHPGLAALLADQLDALRAFDGEDRLRQRMASVFGRIELVHADARDVLRELADDDSARPDAVYVDPMYPPRRKQSAKPRKRIELARRLLGPSEAADAPELLRAGVACATQRVIVKRPHDAPPLADDSADVPPPDFTIDSKLVRYDVHTKKR